MPASLTAYLPDAAAAVLVLEDHADLVIGRDAGCDLQLDHGSVSRRHARLRLDGDQARVVDLDSKNGVFLEGERIQDRSFSLPAWLRLGDVYGELETVDADAANRLRDEGDRRRAVSAVMARDSAGETDLDRLLQLTLRSAMEIADCERGFLLISGEDRRLRLGPCAGLEAAEFERPGFSGSLAAVRRCVLERHPVVANDIEAGHWLASRPSVVRGSIRSLVALPMTEGGTLLGVAYLDSRRGGAAITRLDLELLTAFVERMAVTLAARQVAKALRGRDATPMPWLDQLEASGSPLP